MSRKYIPQKYVKLQFQLYTNKYGNLKALLFKHHYLTLFEILQF